MKVKCKSCGWEGDDSELDVEYVTNPKDHHDVIPESRCPVCGNSDIDYGELVPA